MLTEKDIYRMEREVRQWHAQSRPGGRPVTSDRSGPRLLGRATRWLWQMLIPQATPVREPAARPLQPGTQPALDLLRAVARGEVSPELANQMLSSG